MRTRTRGLVAALALVLSASLTACGGGDEEKASKAISDSLMQENEESLSVTQEQADCISDGFVDKIGVDQLKEYGVLTDDLEATDTGDIELSEEDAGKAADSVMDCADFKEMFAQGFGEDLPAEAKECVDTALTDDVVKQFLTGIFAGSTDGQQELQAALSECVAGGQG